MSKMLVAYYSATGNTKAMAEEVARGARQGGAEVNLLPVEDVMVDSLLDYDAVILGSPVYYGTMAAQVKKLLDESVRLHGSLAGKTGGAFASSANIGGGNETTVLSIVQALLIHGMIVPGVANGDHYGPVAINAPDDRATKQCFSYGRMIAELTTKLSG